MTDIKIIGAGPGGLFSGLYLLEKGFVPTIFEKQSREDYESTPCGEGISVDSIKKLEQDVGFVSKPFISAEVGGVVFCFPEGNRAFLESEGVVLDRTDWLKALAEEFENRGGEIEYGKEIGNPGDLEYDYLIGAEGPVSKTRELIDGAARVVAGCQYKFRPDDYQNDFLEFHLNKKFSDYYSWVFPKGDYLTIGCGGKIGDLDRFLESREFEGEILEREMHPVTFSGEKFQEENVFLIGDAGGMVNPVTGAGLGPIILASEVLSDCIDEGNPGEYEGRVREILVSPEITDMLMGLSQSYFKKLGDLVDGEYVRDFVKKNNVLDMIRGNFFSVLGDPSFLIKTRRLYKRREEMKKAFELW